MPIITVKNLTVNSVIEQLTARSKSQFTGRLDIREQEGQQWHLYLGLGRIVWATGGSHPYRRLRRLLAQHCPQANASNFRRETDNNNIECWDYHLLTVLARRKQLALPKVTIIVAQAVVEILFDLLQQGYLNQLSDANSAQPTETEVQTLLVFPNAQTQLFNSFSMQLMKGVRPCQQAMLPANCVIDFQQALVYAQKMWAQWQRAGLQAVSPNFAPTLSKPELLRRQMSAASYKNLVSLADGRRTLRDLSFLLKSKPLQVAQSLFPYIRQGTIEPIAVPDLPFKSAAPASPLKDQSRPSSKGKKRPFLIACIDDSPQVCRVLDRTLSEAGYRFTCIQDSTLALPLLLESKPDLIFLDLVMPIANGYELCSQIRRISFFQNTPIVILTGRDGIVDRVRAKMVGATDYLHKPIDPQQILEAIKKYVTSSRR